MSYFKYKISNIPVIFEDDWLLVVDKPSGLLTIPTPQNEPRTLTSILNQEFKKKNEQVSLHPCHRLDRETSGLIIYAKGKSVQKKMMELFKNRLVRKKYIAFVHGKLAQDQGQISSHIDELAALTDFRVIERKKDFTVVEVHPLTGRTNQIRIHFKGVGHPLVGEARYAFRKDFSLKGKRLFLHAKAINFTHPVTEKNVSISISLEQDMQDFLKLH